MSTHLGEVPASKHSAFHGQAVQRRKIRKGTFSCWECKRRKTRCRFQRTSDSICLNCQRYEVPCISQEIAESTVNDYDEAERRLVQVETLVNQLQQQRNTTHRKDERTLSIRKQGKEDSTTATLVNVRPAPKKIKKNRIQYSPLFSTLTESTPSMCSSLNDYLESILPHSTTAKLILSCGWSPFAVLEQSGRMSKYSNTNELGRQSGNPISLAQHLILLALCLERLSLNPVGTLDLQLDGSSCAIARRYVDAARQVTCRDSFVRSFEGLETLMLQCSFETSIGDVQSAWLNIRRALSFAQMIDRTPIVGQAADRAKMIRRRLVLYERTLSLMLGLPSAVADDIFATERLISNESPSIRLESIHAAVSRRLITRNIYMQERLHREDGLVDAYDDYEETQSIDHELKQAIRFLFVDGWNQTTMPTKTSDARSFIEQAHHYDLLVLVHLPYLIHGPHCQSFRMPSGSKIREVNRDYSRFAAVSASREVLFRVLLCCNNRQIRCSLSALSHKTFTSSVALLLAHIDGHALGRGNVLEYQRPRDLKIIREVISHMEDVSRSSETNLSCWSTQVVQELLAVEEEAANGHLYVVLTGDKPQENGSSGVGHGNIKLQLDLPYFKAVRVERQQAYLAQSDETNWEPDCSTESVFTTGTRSYSNIENIANEGRGIVYTPAETSWFPLPCPSISNESQFLIDQEEQNMTEQVITACQTSYWDTSLEQEIDAALFANQSNDTT